MQWAPLNPQCPGPPPGPATRVRVVGANRRHQPGVVPAPPAWARSAPQRSLNPVPVRSFSPGAEVAAAGPRIAPPLRSFRWGPDVGTHHARHPYLRPRHRTHGQGGIHEPGFPARRPKETPDDIIFSWWAAGPKIFLFFRCPGRATQMFGPIPFQERSIDIEASPVPSMCSRPPLSSPQPTGERVLGQTSKPPHAGRRPLPDAKPQSPCSGPRRKIENDAGTPLFWTPTRSRMGPGGGRPQKVVPTPPFLGPGPPSPRH